MLTTIVTALLVDIAEFSAQVSLVVLAALGIALAIYGVRYGWGLFQTFVRVRATTK